MTQATGQLHRFRDSVAVWVGKGETVYMSADEAEAFAKALQHAAQSIRTEGFAQSTCGTVQLKFSGR